MYHIMYKHTYIYIYMHIYIYTYKVYIVKIDWTWNDRGNRRRIGEVRVLGRTI